MVADRVARRRSSDAVRSRLRSLAIELWPVVVVAFAGLIALGHIADSPWKDLFLYNGDSIALPLIEQSIQDGEPFRWVFSSQNFLFPEGPLYVLSTIFTNSARVALLTNAVLNLVSLYILLRTIAHLLAHRSRHRLVEITIALGSTFLFVVFVLLEPTDAVNRSAIATLFLLTTYYYGVILSGLGLVALVLWVSRSFGPLHWGRKRSIIFATSTATLVGLTTFSDPLFLFQVIAPFVAVIAVLIFCNRLSWTGAGVLVGPIFVGGIVAMYFRHLFASSFASEVSSYLAISKIPDSLKVLWVTLKELLSSGPGTLKLLLVCLLFLITAAILMFALYAQSRPRLAKRVSTADLFITAFVIASAISLLLGEVFTGSTTTRYLEPLFIFPLLTSVAVGVYVLRRMLAEVSRADLRRNLSRFVTGIAILASLLIVVTGGLNVPAVASMARGDGYTAARCFDRFIGSSRANGVGTFWSVRQLDLYGTQRGALLQVREPIVVFGWISNIAPYEHKKFSYVVQDDSGQITPDAIATLGEPSQVVKCPSYTIYDYRGTPGEQILTDRIAASLEPFLRK